MTIDVLYEIFCNLVALTIVYTAKTFHNFGEDLDLTVIKVTK